MTAQPPIVPKKVRLHARYVLRGAVRYGRITRPKICESCGKKPKRGDDGRSGIEAHHHKGYDKPLDVRWLCIPCHKRADPILTIGERNGRALLTEKSVRRIRSLYSTKTVSELSEQFGVSGAAIQHVVYRRSWAHVK